MTQTRLEPLVAGADACDGDRRRRCPASTTRSASSRSASGSSPGGSSSKHRLALIGLVHPRDPDRRRRHRPDPACRSSSPTSPSPTRSCPRAGRRRCSHTDRRDRRPPARRAHARRQRRPDVAAHRLHAAWSIGVDPGHDRRRDRRLRRRLRRQRPDAHRRRHAQPAAPVRDPRRGRASSAAATVSARSSSSSACFGWMGVSRLVRSLFLSIREREFVEAARAVGVRDRRIIFRHILPNAFSPIVVVASLLDRAATSSPRRS